MGTARRLSASHVLISKMKIKSSGVKNVIAMMGAVAQSVCKMVAEHVIAALVIVVIIVCLVGAYYAFQHGVIDDKAEAVIEIPFGS